MKRFANLYRDLDQTTSTKRKIAAMRQYFEAADAEDSAWALYLLSGRRMKRLVGTANLRQWLVETSMLPAWLVEEVYANVGDLAETAALLTDSTGHLDGLADRRLSEWMHDEILALRDLSLEEQRRRIMCWWSSLDYDMNYLVTKLLTGALRVGVSQLLVARAVAEHAGLPSSIILHRLTGHWQPTKDFFHGLIAPETGQTHFSQPYPFCLASPLDQGVTVKEVAEQLGDILDWHIEWKWDGIRAQIVRRNGECFIWSRGEELVTDRFPEVRDAVSEIPEGTVLDGEILAWSEDVGVLEFTLLQRRINRKHVSAKMLRDIPICFMAYDLIESNHQDVRERSTEERRALLEEVCPQASPLVKISPLLPISSWENAALHREQSRERRVEGLMLKHRQATYETGRRRGQWWKWKVTPFTVDAVMLYAQPGHGRRANLYTDYTFAVWREDELVPIAKAYSGLDSQEINELDTWIRKNTTERFGPVRSVKPEQVFELAFEGINRSKRHKSGVAVRFPRITRWRRDLSPKDANTIGDLQSQAEQAEK